MSVCVITDENLGERAVTSKAKTEVALADIAYLSSHGRIKNSQYLFRVHDGDWPVVSDIGTPGPRVAVFDTCDLVEPSKTLKQCGWLATGRSCPAVVLGYRGAASDSYKATARGKEFAVLLAAGYTFCSAWIDAVRSTDPSGRDVPIAVAFGPDATTARHTYDTASLANMPSPTTADECYWKSTP